MPHIKTIQILIDFSSLFCIIVVFIMIFNYNGFYNHHNK